MHNSSTELARAKGFGSSKSGSHHWWQQRFTAIMLIFFTIWLLIFIKSIASKEFSNIVIMIQKPYNLLPLAIFVVVALYHGTLGMQVVIEDYTSCIFLRFALIVMLKIFTLVTATAFLVSLFYVVTL